ncbi:MAG: hypothetical protein EF812_05230 [Methanosarcinales archaeon]|nr:MAG: hypothetical protein EF812_05230 [Methanosarcinales archaeon]
MFDAFGQILNRQVSLYLNLNGNSVIDFKENSKKESICEFFGEIRSINPGKTIVIILDNFSSHRAKDTTRFTEENGIVLVFLPPCSPDLESN